jgi:hypothetical protein
VHWAVLPGKAVSRLLRICNPDNALPVAESVPDILDENEKPRQLFQLVPQPR